MSVARIFAIGSALFVLFAIGVGLYLSGSPKEQRVLRFDRERVQELKNISYAIRTSWGRVEKLPTDLSELVDGHRLQAMPTDPQTDEPYEYELLSDNSYRLCSTFNLASQDVTPTDFWSHQEGYQCFDFTLEYETK